MHAVFWQRLIHAWVTAELCCFLPLHTKTVANDTSSDLALSKQVCDAICAVTPVYFFSTAVGVGWILLWVLSALQLFV